MSEYSDPSISPVKPVSDDAASQLEAITAGSLSLKIAETEQEIEQAQRLRYEVFYEEMGAKPSGKMGEDQREIEFYDQYCEHLLVVDNELPKDRQVVGTYRILKQNDAEKHAIPFYTETEFDLRRLRSAGGRIMEVSRSCVLESHRSKTAINLLWKGIAVYVFANKIDYLIGTPSLNGTDINEHAPVLAYLNAFHLADEAIRPRVLDAHYNPLPVLDKESIDAKRAFMALPPLLKGYLRIGAVVGDGAFIDHQFNCIDVAIVVPIANVTDRYFNHYTRGETDHAAR